MRICIISLIAILPCLGMAIPAFPGAEGFGASATGGRGGRVILVTNNNSSGAGSLKAALWQTGPRIIVFRTSGVIDLGINFTRLGPTNGDFYLAGQTSPGGITLISSLSNQSQSAFMCYNPCGMNNFIMRYVRVRGGADNMDGMTLNPANNFIIDHCDFSGGSDETMDITHSNDFTVQWSTVANSSEGQTYGALIAYPPTTNVTIHHNLFAHHVNRCGPYSHWEGSTGAAAVFDNRNNVYYDAQDYSIRLAINESYARYNLIGNYFKDGPATPSGMINPRADLGTANIYADDNIWVEKSGVLHASWNFRKDIAAPHNTPLVTTESAADAYESVLAKVGALPRDEMNIRTVNDVRTGGGALRQDKAGWISSGPQPPVDGDQDGMPDYWESNMGFNPNAPADNLGDHDNDGYTNIEEYINDLALILQGDPPQNDNTGIETVRGGLATSGAGSLELVPNPVGAGTPVEFQLLSLTGGRKLAGRVEVMDVSGRVIAGMPAGARTLWHGRDRLGKPAAAGLYVVRWVASGRQVAAKRLMILK